MAEHIEKNKTQRGFFGNAIHKVMVVILWLAASLVFSLIVEWVGLAFFWSAEGAGHSARVLANDAHYLNFELSRSWLGLISSGAIGATIADHVYYVLFQFTHIEDVLNVLKSKQIMSDVTNATFNTLQSFCVRLAITVLALPLFVLAAVWGLCEGQIRRELRKYGADIERGFIYHIAKYTAGGVIIIPIILYLSLPMSVNPGWVFVPFAAVLAINMMVMSATFMKYT